MAVATAFGAHTVRPGNHIGVADFALAHAFGEGGEGVGDVAAHELPDHAERERALSVGYVGALDSDEAEAVLLADFDGVVGILDCFEAAHARFDRQVLFIRVLGCRGDGVGRWLVDVPPVDAAGDHFVVGLEQDRAVFQVVEEGHHGGLDVKAVEPEGEDAGFALAFGVEVFDFLLFFLRDGVEARVVVEEIGDEGEVEFGIAGDERCWSQEFAAWWVEAVGVLEDLLGALVEVGGLQGAAGADVRCELVEEDGVIFAVFDVGGEVLDSVKAVSKSVLRSN